jgi:hypothetical protein
MQNYQILGQVCPTSGTLTAVYSCNVKAAIISSIIACNVASDGASFWVSVCSGGGSDNIAQYIYSNIFLPAFDSFGSTQGITVRSGDVIRVKTDASTAIAFSVFGGTFS